MRLMPPSRSGHALCISHSPLLPASPIKTYAPALINGEKIMWVLKILFVFHDVVRQVRYASQNRCRLGVTV